MSASGQLWKTNEQPNDWSTAKTAVRNLTKTQKLQPENQVANTVWTLLPADFKERRTWGAFILMLRRIMLEVFQEEQRPLQPNEMDAVQQRLAALTPAQRVLRFPEYIAEIYAGLPQWFKDGRSKDSLEQKWGHISHEMELEQLSRPLQPQEKDAVKQVFADLTLAQKCLPLRELLEEMYPRLPESFKEMRTKNELEGHLASVLIDLVNQMQEQAVNRWQIIRDICQKMDEVEKENAKLQADNAKLQADKEEVLQQLQSEEEKTNKYRRDTEKTKRKLEEAEAEKREAVDVAEEAVHLAMETSEKCRKLQERIRKLSKIDVADQ